MEVFVFGWCWEIKERIRVLKCWHPLPPLAFTVICFAKTGASCCVSKLKTNDFNNFVELLEEKKRRFLYCSLEWNNWHHPGKEQELTYSVYIISKCVPEMDQPENNKQVIFKMINNLIRVIWAGWDCLFPENCAEIEDRAERRYENKYRAGSGIYKKDGNNVYCFTWIWDTSMYKKSYFKQ